MSAIKITKDHENYAALLLAVEKAGGAKKLSRALNLSVASINNWLYTAKRIPFKHVPKISSLLEIPKHVLRGDFFIDGDG
jgi:DNA-binding transcriptional regulator YdaS (Cro superfamily)